MESEYWGFVGELRTDAEIYSFVLFNRQPSLHKMSMMSHRVKLMPYSSELFHVPFDGLMLNLIIIAFRLNRSV